MKGDTMKMRTWVLILAILALGAAACGYSDVSATTTTAAATSGGDAGGAAGGQEIFKTTCSACHGQNADGVDGLGPDMHDNEFIQSQSDADLIEFISIGRSTTDPGNTSGVAMPPKGGNSSLTNEDIADVVDYLRTLQ